MTAGLWGGFGLGIMMTKDDCARSHGSAQQAQRRAKSGFARDHACPWVGNAGHGSALMAGGTF